MQLKMDIWIWSSGLLILEPIHPLSLCNEYYLTFTSDTGVIALNFAAQNGHLDIVNALIEKNVDQTHLDR